MSLALTRVLYHVGNPKPSSWQMQGSQSSSVLIPVDLLDWWPPTEFSPGATICDRRLHPQLRCLPTEFPPTDEVDFPTSAESTYCSSVVNLPETSERRCTTPHRWECCRSVVRRRTLYSWIVVGHWHEMTAQEMRRYASNRTARLVTCVLFRQVCLRTSIQCEMNELLAWTISAYYAAR